MYTSFCKEKPSCFFGEIFNLNIYTSPKSFHIAFFLAERILPISHNNCIYSMLISNEQTIQDLSRKTGKHVPH